MPHVTIKMRAGRSDEQKAALATTLADTIAATLGVESKFVSIAIDDVEGKAWKSDVYDTEIMADPARLYKKPGYSL